MNDLTPKADHTFKPANGTADWCAVCFYSREHQNHRDGWEGAIARAIVPTDGRSTLSAVMALIAPLIQSAPFAPAPAWQPIATVHQHDGEWLMVINATAPERKPWFIRWNGDGWEHQNGEVSLGVMRYGRRDGEPDGFERGGTGATHWQLMPKAPLPAAPTDPEGAR